MSDNAIDILMITYNRPAYTRLSLSRLLETCDESMRVWLWHNGTHAETLGVVESLKNHPRVHRFHHSPENRKLREPTNWLYTESTGAYVSKVDDDCLVPPGWAQKLREAHEAEARLGIVACWHFLPEDFIPELASSRIATVGGGHRILRNLWVGGSAYLMKRACVNRAGRIRDDESFTSYCIRIARLGWLNGWYYPFLCQEHMDDPRVPHTALRSDADIASNLPLSAQQRGVTTIAAWQEQLLRSARLVQEAPLNPSYYSKWRSFLRRAWQRARKGAA
jgi:glycosyltransferase involved in cell wall biosynthesis